MASFTLFTFFMLLVIQSSYAALKSSNFEDLRAKENETRTSVDFAPPNLLKQSIPDDLEVLSCGNEAVSVFDGSAYIIRSENFPRKAPVDTDCSFNFEIRPGVAVDLMCKKIHLPCKKKNYLDISSSVTEETASICTTNGVQLNERISIATQNEPMDLVISHRIDSKTAGRGFSCVVRGLGGEQREGPEERVDLTVDDGNSTGSGVQSRSLSNCGRTRYTRIINGGQASAQEYPWAVHLWLNGGFCGGSLINNWWILTAAHCSIGAPTSRIVAFLGCQGRYCNVERRLISRNVIPSGYRFPVHDIALLRMSAPITQFSNTIRNVCLSRTLRAADSRLAISGWGTTQQGSLAPSLKEAILATVSDATCRSPTPIVCTRQITGNVCFGDSGSPVVYIRSQNNVQRYVQYGIVSFVTSNTCDPRFLSGHTEVPYYVSWIIGIAGQVALV